ncbi:MAG: hypothetical protein KJ714_05005 [Euryarchaeota archaeon]|nr:hypothetical protein [Euryarchaeota archaeon]
MKDSTKILRIKSIPAQKQRAQKESKLDEYKDYIINKLHENPFTASLLFREIQEMGQGNTVAPPYHQERVLKLHWQ